MTSNSLNQLQLFMLFIANGILIGVLFDLFRIFRKSFKTSNLITYIQDILFWILTGLLLIYFIFVFNNGEIRGYIFIALFFGIAIYILSISKYFIKVSVCVLNYIKIFFKRIFKLIITPVKILINFVKKILIKPFFILFVNFRKKSFNIIKNIKKNDKKISN